MRGSATANQDDKLMDHLSFSDDYGRLLGIFATTYEMQSDFIETDFLPTLFGLGAWDDRSHSSRIAIEKSLAEIDCATILMDAHCYRSRPRTMRVEVQPVWLRSGKILHSKVLILVYEKAVRLFVGSANLTEPGYRLNREVIAVITATAKRPAEARLIAQAIEGLYRTLDANGIPNSRGITNEALARVASWSVGSTDHNRWFVWGGGDEALWRQFIRHWPKGEPVKRITIVSPFWSEESKAGTIRALIQEVKAWSGLAAEAELLLMTEAAPDRDRTFKPALPESFQQFDARSHGIRVSAVAVDPRIPSEETGVETEAIVTRSLHAKIVLMEGQDTTQIYCGSANFTDRGWGFRRSPETANIEAGLIIQSSGRKREILRKLLPPATGNPIPLNGAAEIGLVAPESVDSESPWPHFIREILLAPSQDDVRLELRVSLFNDPPDQWKVVISSSHDSVQQVLYSIEDPSRISNEHRVKLDTETFNRLIIEQEVLIQWPQRPDGIAYPLNVNRDARAELPISPGTGRPGEHDLVSYYQGKISWEDLFPAHEARSIDEQGNLIEQSVDPSGVETSRIQSYVVREFVEALSGIRSDLREAAVSTKPCMRLALLGPSSPISLADCILKSALSGEKTATAAGFQLIEIQACLEEARFYPASEQYETDWIELVKIASGQISPMLDQLLKRFPNELTGNFRIYAERVHNLHKSRPNIS